MASKIKEVAASVKDKVTGHSKHVRILSASCGSLERLSDAPSSCFICLCCSVSRSFMPASHLVEPCRQRLSTTMQIRRPTRKEPRTRKTALVSFLKCKSGFAWCLISFAKYISQSYLQRMYNVIISKCLQSSTLDSAERCLYSCTCFKVNIMIIQFCAVANLKDSAAHTKDAAGAKFNKNMAEAKQHVKSGEHPELAAKKEAAKSQEKASASAAKGHADDVSPFDCCHIDPTTHRNEACIPDVRAYEENVF